MLTALIDHSYYYSSCQCIRIKSSIACWFVLVYMYMSASKQYSHVNQQALSENQSQYRSQNVNAWLQEKEKKTFLKAE